MSVLPPELSPFGATLLIVASAFTSGLTAAFGIGGGMVLLSVMAAVVPPTLLIPLHGLVQVGSNAGRAALMARDVVWPRIGWFVPGALLGVFVGGLVVVALPAPILRGAVGVFVLITAWRKPTQVGGGRAALLIGGALSSVLTMFVGATGPFVVALFRGAQLEPKPLVATAAVAMLSQHALKVVAFGLLGVSFGPWMPVLLAMLASGFLGTYLGGKLLDRIPRARFASVLRWILSAAGLSLLIGALGAIG